MEHSFKKVQKKKELTFFLNDRLNNVMNMMVDSFIHSGSHVDDGSFLVNMKLTKKKKPRQKSKSIKREGG